VHSGGYGFVWARDLTYVMLALLACGRNQLAAHAARWLASSQSPDGSWAQRHWTNGRIAPSWCPHQLDETGSALFALEAVWRGLGDDELDRELWPVARRGAELLLAFRDPETGLVRPSFDLWEEREGVHAYTVAATVAGLRSASAFAARHEPGHAEEYATAAEELARALERAFWSEPLDRFVRSPDDETVDVSLLGLAWPFGAVDPSSDRMRATAAAVATRLRHDGGLLRYEGDRYAGGNSWILAALWLGLWRRQVGDVEGVDAAVRYAIECQNEHGLLAEQVDAEQRPVWVLPLAWSHALLVLAARPEEAIVRDATTAQGTSAEQEAAPAH
jgi:glucoamylase